MDLPNDALANALCRLPLPGLAIARCVCKAWRDVIDARALLIPHLLPRSVHGIFINYVDHGWPHLFAAPSPSTITIDGMLSFLPNDHDKDTWSVLDHCNGLVLCNINKESSLCVCNPATLQWTLLPRCEETGNFKFQSTLRGYAGAYLAFDPAVSPHYEVVLIPRVPQKPAPPSREERARRWREELADLFCLDWFFDSPEGTLPVAADDAGEPEEVYDSRDPTRLTEWPPSPWTLNVFSSKTGRWGQRDFVREGDPAGLVKHMRMQHYSELRWYGPRRRYAVYWQGALYVHCHGAFVARILLSMGIYQIITVPTFIEGEMPYMGRSKQGIYFARIHEEHLNAWILDESNGQMEWVLKYRHGLRNHSRFVSSFYRKCKHMAGTWRVEEDNAGMYNESSDTSIESSHYSKSADDVPSFKAGDEEQEYEENFESDGDEEEEYEGNFESDGDEEEEYEENFESDYSDSSDSGDTETVSFVWDPDNGNFQSDEEDDEGFQGINIFNILGFHPYEEVAFLSASFGAAAYHLSSSKIQYLGNTRPKSYQQNQWNGTHESFVYTPCVIGVHHGDSLSFKSFLSS